MAKTLTIRIKPIAEAMDTFRASFRAVVGAGGRRLRRRPCDDVFFSSIEAARKLLTPTRLALLRAIRVERPPSIYALAQLVGRDLKNVQQDVRLLETYGLVRMGRSRRGRRGRNPKTPEAVFDEIALRIAI
jgi:predicted transcriptional regulator